MNEAQVVDQYLHLSEKLAEQALHVNTIGNNFVITNSHGRVIATVQSVDGIEGFYQAYTWAAA